MGGGGGERDTQRERRGVERRRTEGRTDKFGWRLKGEKEWRETETETER